MLRVLGVVALSMLMACADPKQQRLDAWIATEQAQGNMKTDRAPSDAVVNADILVQNFERIAFEDEDQFGERKKKNLPKAASMLRKWKSEIRYRVFGRNLGAALSYPHVEEFMGKLAEITKVDVRNWRRFSEEERRKKKANFFIAAGNAVEFNDQARRLPEKVANLKEGKGRGTRIFADFMKVWHPSGSPCALKLFTRHVDGVDTGEILFVLIMMRTDVVSILRDACVEEELSQAMGLLNDHPEVRPSIYNDDQEYALLTKHDELLLQILYDDRLTAGMTPDVAMPIVRQIAAELLPDA